VQVTGDRDDPLRTREVKLEVGIIRDGHEFCVARLAQNGMVRVGEVDYLKVERLGSEIQSSSECDG
jgi:hypothetical protein